VIEPPDMLTSQGQARRETIFRLMQEAARRRRTRRRIIRSSAGCAVIVLIMTVAIRWRSHGGGGGAMPLNYATTHPAPIAPPSDPRVVIGRIETDPTILARWSIAPREQPIQSLPSIDDDDLIRTLADAGQPEGLIQVGGQTTLVTSSAAQ